MVTLITYRSCSTQLNILDNHESYKQCFQSGQVLLCMSVSMNWWALLWTHITFLQLSIIIVCSSSHIHVHCYSYYHIAVGGKYMHWYL